MFYPLVFIALFYLSTGYANEVGEAFRVWISPFWVRATYGVASAYVLADTYDKGSKAAQVCIMQCTM